MKFILSLLSSIIIYSEYHSQQENVLNQNYSTYKEITEEIDKKGNQFASWRLSRIGEYSEAKKLFESTKKYNFENENSVDYQLVNSIHFIDSLSKVENVIFINEAHHVSQHRNYIRHLLPILYKNGYRYLGMEAFNSSDTLIYERGYPIKESGFYTKDPEYANLIRDAINLGFEIFGYEASKGKDGREREIEQAKNIISKTIQKDEKAKMLIIAGFDHIREDTLFYSWEKAMAGRFYEYSGINPITIDQVQFSPMYNDENTNPLIKNKIIQIASIPIAINKDNVFKNPYSKKGFDFYIFHPKYQMKDNVIEWKLTFDRSPLFVRPEIVKNNKDYLILAYDFIEYQKEQTTKRLIPMDIVSVRSENMPLSLKKGKYFIEIIDSNKNIIYTEIVTQY